MSVAFYFDNNMQTAAVAALRASGFDALTALEDEYDRHPDEDVLDRAMSLRRVVVTHDQDFLDIAADRQIRSEEFPGIVFCHLAGWHRLARFGAYRCALAQELCRDTPHATRTSFGCASPVAQSGNRGHPAGSIRGDRADLGRLVYRPNLERGDRCFASPAPGPIGARHPCRSPRSRPLRIADPLIGHVDHSL